MHGLHRPEDTAIATRPEAVKQQRKTIQTTWNGAIPHRQVLSWPKLIFIFHKSLPQLFRHLCAATRTNRPHHWTDYVLSRTGQRSSGRGSDCVHVGLSERHRCFSLLSIRWLAEVCNVFCRAARASSSCNYRGCLLFVHLRLERALKWCVGFLSRCFEWGSFEG